ncbi:MAG TPA: lysoplasmalogenase, partial [Anaerolineaceae bacterium]|nr:lysoplasmalogenase [Anaerolineaceae bacterium]
LLMRSRFFVPGLFSFLFAHIFYIIGFAYGTIEWNWWAMVPLGIISLLILVAYPRIIGGIRRRLEHRRLWLPVVLYMVTITIILLMAMLTWFRPIWNYPAVLFVSVGALLFTISDTVLATGRFLRPIPYGNFLVMFTYHLGQLGIAIGALNMLGLF